MLRCRELSRLPKLPKTPRAKSVDFRRQTPGSVVGVLRPSNGLTSYLDPTHPATSIPKHRFPSFQADALNIRAFPFALLTPPEQAWTPPLNRPIHSWEDRVKRFISANAELASEGEPLSVEPMELNNSKNGRVPMSFVNATSKKRTSNKRHIRHKIASRLKIAINLIVSRGADTVGGNGKRKLVMNEEEVERMADKWVSPGWTYIFFPTLEIYRMPYHDLIPMLRKALRQIWDHSQQLEKGWAEAPLKAATTKPVPSKHNFTKPRTGTHSGQQRTPTSRRAFSTSSVSARDKFAADFDSSDNHTIHPVQRQSGAPNTSSKKRRAFHEPTTPDHTARLDEAIAPEGLPSSTSYTAPVLHHGDPASHSEIHKPGADVDDGMPVRDRKPPVIARHQNAHRGFGLRSIHRRDERHVPRTTSPDGSHEALKPMIPSGIEFKTPAYVSPQQRSGRRAVEDNDASPKPLTVANAELLNILKSERDNAAMWFGRSQMLQYQKWRRNRAKQQALRAKKLGRDLPVNRFLDFGVPPAPPYDPFADDDAIHGGNPGRAHPATPGYASYSSLRPAPSLSVTDDASTSLRSATLPPYSYLEKDRDPIKVVEGQVDLTPKPTIPRQQFNAHLDAFDPFPEPQPAPHRVTSRTTSAASIPDFDPFPTVPLSSERFSDFRFKTSSWPQPNENPSPTLTAVDPSPEVQPHPAAVSTAPPFPDFDPFAPTTEAVARSAKLSAEAEAPQRNSLWKGRRALSNKLYRSEPVILPWWVQRRHR